MDEKQLIEMKKKALDIRMMIEKCNNLIEYIESFTKELAKGKSKTLKDNVLEDIKNIE